MANPAEQHFTYDELRHSIHKDVTQDLLDDLKEETVSTQTALNSVRTDCNESSSLTDDQQSNASDCLYYLRNSRIPSMSTPHITPSPTHITLSPTHTITSHPLVIQMQPDPVTQRSANSVVAESPSAVSTVSSTKSSKLLFIDNDQAANKDSYLRHYMNISCAIQHNQSTHASPPKPVVTINRSKKPIKWGNDGDRWLCCCNSGPEENWRSDKDRH